MLFRPFSDRLLQRFEILQNCVLQGRHSRLATPQIKKCQIVQILEITKFFRYSTDLKFYEIVFFQVGIPS